MSGQVAEPGAPVIQAVGLRKSYGSVEAVRDLSFEVIPGSVYGLLGLNGAGKTTAIRLILGLLSPDAGRSTVFGEDSLALPRPPRGEIEGLVREELARALGDEGAGNAAGAGTREQEGGGGSS